MVLDASLLSVCGRYCGNCVWHLGERDTVCPGCNAHRGNPWWGECQVYKCASEHGAEYCGVCAEFPCDLLMGYYDPGNPEGPRNAAIRVAVNAIRAKHGDVKTLEYLEKTGPLNKPVD